MFKIKSKWQRRFEELKRVVEFERDCYEKMSKQYPEDSMLYTHYEAKRIAMLVVLANMEDII